MIDDKLWGIRTWQSKPVTNYRNINTTGWHNEVRSCRICGRMAHAPIHPDAYKEWQDHKDQDDAEKYLGVKVVNMALKGLTCDNCATTREMYLNSREGIEAIAIELLRVNDNGDSNLTEQQEERLMAGLRRNMKSYCDALRRMNGMVNVIFDDLFVRMVWERPKGCWNVLSALQIYLYRKKPTKAQYADITNYLKRRSSIA